MRCYFFIFLLFSVYAGAQSGLQPIGTWRDHLPYHSAVDVTQTENKIFASTPFSIFSLHKTTGEAERYSKISGLSETGISTIGYEPTLQKLVVAYTNSNIDILSQNDIINIPGLKRENIIGDKNIYHIYPAATLCYLSTGLGVVVLDLLKAEIKDTWRIGMAGRPVKVNMFAKDAAFFYAATEEGLKRTPAGATNPADFRAWQNVSGTNGLSATAAKGVVQLGGKIIVLQNDSLFIQNGTAWNLLYAGGNHISFINVSGNTMAVGEQLAPTESKVMFINADGAVQKIFQQPGKPSNPKKAVAQGNNYWIADSMNGLLQWNGNSIEQHVLNSPQNIATGELTVYNNVLYAAAGGVNSNWIKQHNGNGVYQYKEGQWTNYNRQQFPLFDSSLTDFVTVAVDPRDESAWAGSFGGGLLHLKKDNTFEVFKQNTPLGATGNYRVSGLQFDAAHNLWVANFGATAPLHVLKNDGSWKSFTPPFSLVQNAVAQIVVDDLDQKWIVSPLGNGLLCFNHGASVDDAGDDRWKLYKAGAGNGNLPSNNVLCIAKDKDGLIWVGTADGVGIIPCPQEVFTGGCEALLPVARDGAFAGYLFKGEAVRSIAVDGANRKWIATGNGAWLINAEGDGVLTHFTAANSALLSNDVQKVAINGTTGEVFFATGAGICSFMGTATESTATTNSLLIFPNPVPPGYTGSIAIRGLAANSSVKITELNGRLVYQSKALGGQVVWNGRDYRGNRPATGVYLVLVTGTDKKEKAAGKIVFISK